MKEFPGDLEMDKGIHNSLSDVRQLTSSSVLCFFSFSLFFFYVSLPFSFNH